MFKYGRGICGFIFDEDDWMRILSDVGKYSREARGKYIQYKVVHGYYYTPPTCMLFRMGITENSLLLCESNICVILNNFGHSCVCAI